MVWPLQVCPSPGRHLPSAAEWEMATEVIHLGQPPPVLPDPPEGAEEEDAPPEGGTLLGHVFAGPR